MTRFLAIWTVFLTGFASCAQQGSKSPNSSTIIMNTMHTENTRSGEAGTTDTATFANGCFWCTEAIFEQLDGVVSAVSGYSGGHTQDPSYEEVSTGETGFAEALQIVYDPAKISNDDIQKKIAAVGHDTEKYTAIDSVYQKLPGCCHYERKKINPEQKQ